jgi:hypothetical protein
MNKPIAKENGVESREAGCVLVLYESPAGRERAISFCEEFTKQSGAAAELGVRCFSFDSLKVPAKSDEAISNAEKADLIVFAVTSVGDLPAEIKIWTENWLGKRGEREGALVGLILGDAANPCEIACLKEVYLRHLAHRAGMDYLSHVPPMIPREIPDSLDSFSQRAGQVTSVLDEILHTRFVPPRIPLN